MFPACHGALGFAKILAVQEVLLIPLTTDLRDESEEVQAVLASEAFAGSPNLTRLLKYLCTNHFSENKGSLNEYRIGVEALGRPADFDPARNSSVRVEMHRLRSKLRGYYETEGANHCVRIMLEEGHYGLQFVRRGDGLAVSVSELHAAASPDPQQGGKATRRGFFPAEADPPEKVKNIRIGALLSPTGVAIAAALVALALVAGWFLIGAWSRGRSVRSASAPPPSPVGAAPAGSAENGSILILAGYQKEKYVDRDGRVWGGDRYFSGGDAVELRLPFIQGTADPTVYHNARSGDFSYNIPARPGSYELRLHFVETTFGPGAYTGRGESSRVFSVLLGGRPLLTDFDIVSDAGGNYRAFTRVFKGVSPGSDGMVHLKFVRLFDQPIVNGIELVPETGGRLNPVRIVMQENSYVDHAGHLWTSDQDAIGGILDTHRNAAVGTSDPHLFDGERFGHFTYQIPVAPGRYTVTLYFEEAFFGTETATPSVGAGRAFDVYANGEALLRNFDILAQTGGPNRPITETFHGLQPNAAGLIALSFVPVKNYACVNAIEVTDESP